MLSVVMIWLMILFQIVRRKVNFVNNEKLNLTDDLFLGKGNHKIVYAHPTDKNICVKILFSIPDTVPLSV